MSKRPKADSADKTGPLHGTLDLLVLKAVSLQPLHGVGLMQRIEQITGGPVRVSYGSLFPAVHRMEEKGWLVAEWRASDNNRRAKVLHPHARGTPAVASGRRRVGPAGARRVHCPSIDLAFDIHCEAP